MSYQSLDHISNDGEAAFAWKNTSRLFAEEPPLKAGDEVVCEYTFNGVNPEDLPFKSHEVLIIRGPTKDSKWYRAEHPRGESGLIPLNYVRKREDVLHPVAPWFHGKISRMDAERLLLGAADGTYLVRESVKYVGDFTLSVVFEGEVSHYRIKYHMLKFTVDDEDYFLSLHRLIENYTRCEDGLVCRLGEPMTAQQNAALSTLQQQGKLIRREELTFGPLIGKGEFGEVYQGKFRGTQDVALKCLIRDANRAAGGDDEVFTYEAAVMTSLTHKNLVAFIGLVHESDRMVLITEFMSKGSLINYLRSRGRAVISKEDQLRFSIDTCSGMSYLEEKGLVHRDLAARNVLLDGNATAKVADFGLARKVEDLPSSPDPQGLVSDPGLSNVPATNQNRIPIKWTAPEAVRNSLFTNKSDVWSYGILLWEIYSFGRMPYPRIMAAHVVRHIEAGYRMEMPEDCPMSIYTIMRGCWLADTNRRPTFADIHVKLQKIRQSGGTGQTPPQQRPVPPTPPPHVPFL